MPEYSPSFNAPSNDVVEGSRSLPAIASSGLPAMAMAACDLGAMTSRRWQAGEAGGHLFVIFSACKPNSYPIEIIKLNS